MDDYLKQFREMLSLRGLTDHTLTSYSTYISAYLQYLSEHKHCLPVSHSFVFSHFISFTNHGILTSFHSVSLIPICLSFLQEKKCGFFFLPFPTSNSKHFCA